MAELLATGWGLGAAASYEEHDEEFQSERYEQGIAVLSRSVEDTESLTVDELENRICSTAGRIAVATCALLMMIERFDRLQGWSQWGMKSCAHWLAWTCSMSPATAREYVRVARAVSQLPLILDEFARGVLSYSKVRSVTRVAGRVDEQTLLNLAVVETASQLERTVRGFRKADGAGLDQQRLRRARAYWDDDGMLVLSARLPAEEGALVMAAIEAAGLQESQGPGAQHELVADSDRLDLNHQTMSVADSFVSMAKSALSAGQTETSGDDRQLIVLHVGPEAFSSPVAPPVEGCSTERSADKGICHLDDGPGLDTPAMERFACDTAVLVMIKGAAKNVLNVGRKARKISPAMRRALRIRDGGCRYPGCHRRTHLEAHHLIHWMHGGHTDQDNLALLCRFHHMAVHEGGFRVVGKPTSGGCLGLTFWRPDGQRVPQAPKLYPGSNPDLNVCDVSPESLRAGALGEPFSLVDVVAAMTDSVLTRTARLAHATDHGVIEHVSLSVT
ncbi:HNH endonuclease [Nakamurella antarctica]|uniref:HNH endonuclease n=1 Tax=Nakamurella antarctica TaxID=1902245 RepID=A0A3G8ZKG0_9ACTN|nr:HNH endonuclease signature motif containing protein [Nakamurella antarctica]AZI57809.1 HNH endonuclease [Nakamurella antarctica]